MIGKTLQREQSFVSAIGDKGSNPKDLYKYLIQKEEIGGIINFSDTQRPSEIIYLYPVEKTDWIVAAHADLKVLNNNLKSLEFNFIVTQSLTSIIIILLCFFATRFIGGKYERQLEDNNDELKKQVLDVEKISRNLTLYKQRTENNTEKQNRILTYIKDELKPINISDIAYIYTEFKITYVVDFNTKKSISNLSLDELFKKLNKKLFFRANRQYLLSIKSITKIIKYGNSQLKIEISPVSEENIIISKNKTSEFKEWLNS